MPFIDGESILLLHNLPEWDEKYLTNCEALEQSLKCNVTSNMSIIIGTFGSGKTQEPLGRNYDSYLLLNDEFLVG